MGYSLEEIKKIIDNNNGGTIHNFEWQRPLKDSEVKKAFRGRIEKSTIGNYRINLSYQKMKINEGIQTQELPWGQWLVGYENSIIEYKNNYYLRLTPTFNCNQKSKVQWYLDNKPITKKELIEMDALGASQVKEKEEEIKCFVVNIQSLVSIK